MNQFFLFTSQLIYIFIFYLLYFPYVTIEITNALIGIYYGFLIVGGVISIHYLYTILSQLSLNLKLKKKFLIFSYSSLQNLNFQSENYSIIIKMISDVENSKLLSFGLISRIVGIITLFFAVIPNIVYTT